MEDEEATTCQLKVQGLLRIDLPPLTGIVTHDLLLLSARKTAIYRGLSAAITSCLENGPCATITFQWFMAWYWRTLKWYGLCCSSRGILLEDSNHHSWSWVRRQARYGFMATWDMRPKHVT